MNRMSLRSLVNKLSLALGFAALLLNARGTSFTSFNYPLNLPLSGNQNSAGPLLLGNQFTVNSSITVTALGVYDSTLSTTQTGFGSVVEVAIFNVSDSSLVSPIMTFNGTAGNVSASSRFQSIANLVLNPGTYMIVAGGYGLATAVDWNANVAGDTTSPLIFDGGSSLLTLGGADYDFENNGFRMATTRDIGPFPQYAAGTFQYTATVPEPEPLEFLLLGLGSLGLLALARRHALGRAA
jgi:hypothetical protein